MPRIDPSRQDSMSESILRFYHNQNWAQIEFYMKFGRKSTKFNDFQINLIIRFVGYMMLVLQLYVTCQKDLIAKSTHLVFRTISNPKSDDDQNTQAHLS